MLTTLTVLILIAMFIVWKTVIIVPMREMCIVERLGNLSDRVIQRPDHGRGHWALLMFRWRLR